MLEGDPAHRVWPCATPDSIPFGSRLLRSLGVGRTVGPDKGVFKKWKRSDPLKNNRVFSSRYVYKIKRSAKTGAAYRFKTRLIVRGFEVEKGNHDDQNFSPTPGIAIARIITLHDSSSK